MEQSGCLSLTTLQGLPWVGLGGFVTEGCWGTVMGLRWGECQEVTAGLTSSFLGARWGSDGGKLENLSSLCPAELESPLFLLSSPALLPHLPPPWHWLYPAGVWS
jgi:hypothetical protein